eukprot:gb/GFBE01080752.1/.p1 GENE.gb/GFBE01080752.1/~~gb/GFBE01080752.1/.p1  ORF type:complete len:884 (+),score=190.86 gb/GFBE01080752.1/:1-2652(+)
MSYTRVADSCDDPSRPLVAQSNSPRKVQIFGTDIRLNEHDYDFVFVFPILTEEEGKKEEEDAEAVFEKVFRRSVRMTLDGWREQFRGGAVTRKDFQRIVWKTVTDYLIGKECGFQCDWMPSVDKDELFLCVKLPQGTETSKSLAAELGVPVPVTTHAYPLIGHKPPQVDMGIFGESQPALCHLPYSDIRGKAFRETVEARIGLATKELDYFFKARLEMKDKLDLGDTLKEETKVEFVRGIEKLKTEISKGLSKQDVPSIAMKICRERMKAAKQAGKLEEESAYRDLFHLMSARLERLDKERHYKMMKLAEKKGNDAALLEREEMYEDFPNIEQMTSAQLYQDFRRMDYTKIVRGKIQQGFDLGTMVGSGVIVKCFFVHDWKVQEELLKSWANPNPLWVFQLPQKHITAVRNYFGERVGFFYHWMGCYIELLLWPALLGALLNLRFYFLDRSISTILVSLFALIMCVWTTLANGRYNQFAGERAFLWGMLYETGDDVKLATYKPESKGGFKETFFRCLHWTVLCSIAFWTVFAAYKISSWRVEAKQNLSEDSPVDFFWGIAVPSSVVYTYATYLITANIKICSYTWDFVSPMIAERENWATDQDLTDNSAFKSFIVKFIVYYYPFFYTAFCKPFIEGCGHDADGNEIGPEGCQSELRANIGTFLICHLACTIFSLIVPIVQTRIVIWQEQQKAKSNAYDMLQLQAKLPPWAGSTGIDYIDTVINLGFTTMFSCISPGMTILCLITIMIEVRLFAYRDTYLSQRPEPQVATGIGPWLSVMQAMAYISVIVNVAFLSFMMWPLRDMGMHHQLIYFLGLEHAVILITVVLSKAFPHKTADLSIAEEVNNAFLDEVVNGVGVDRKVTPQALKAIYPDLANLSPTACEA